MNKRGLHDTIRSLLSNKWLVTITAIGILLLLFGASGGGVSQSTSPAQHGAVAVSSSASSASENPTVGGGSALNTAIAFENYYDRQLQAAIDQISGVHDAVVLVSVDSTATEKLGENVTVSRQSSTQTGSGNQTATTTTSSSSQVVMVQGSNGQTVPLVVSQQLPHITGVLVIARAADPIRMEAEVSGAVQDVLGIPGFEVTVLPRR